MATMEELLETLLHAKSLIEELPDLSIDDIQDEELPETIELFNSLYTLARSKGYAPQRPDRHLSEDVNDDEEQGDNEQEQENDELEASNERELVNSDEEPSGTAKKDQVGVIVQKLLLQQGSKAMDAGHVLELLTGHPVDVRRKQELAAMKRIFGGINWVDEEDWSSTFQYLAIQDPLTYIEYYQAAGLCNSEPDIKDRLHQRNELIETYTNDITSQRIIHSIFVKIDWIRFAEDYNQLQPRQKSAWLQTGFKRANRNEFDGLSEAESKRKLAEMHEEFIKWKRKMGKDTTSRNRLYELFLKYGAMIILDPVWNIRSLRDHAGSKIHQALLRVPGIICKEQGHPLSHLQPSIEHALVCIVVVIAGEEAGEFVNDFLEEFLPQFDIPRVANYE